MALLDTPMFSSSHLLPRKFPPALANIDREGRTKRPEEHANGNKGLGVRGPFVQKAARRHLPALFPFVPYVASLRTLEGTPGFLWHQQLAVLCRRWPLRVCWGNVLPQGGRSRSAARWKRAQKASCWLRDCAEIRRGGHLVSAVASRDPWGAVVSLLLESQLFLVLLNKHETPH